MVGVGRISGEHPVQSVKDFLRKGRCCATDIQPSASVNPRDAFIVAFQSIGGISEVRVVETISYLDLKP